MFTGEGLRGMTERKNYYAVDTVLPFVAAFIDERLGFVERCGLTQMHVFYTEIMIKVLFGQKSGAWVEDELARLRAKIRKLKSVVEKIFSPHCSSRLFTLRFHLLEHAVHYLGRFGSLSFIDARPFKHFNVLIKKFYRMKSGRLSTRMYETVEKMESALDGVQKAG